MIKTPFSATFSIKSSFIRRIGNTNENKVKEDSDSDRFEELYSEGKIRALKEQMAELLNLKAEKKELKLKCNDALKKEVTKSKQ